MKVCGMDSIRQLFHDIVHDLDRLTSRQQHILLSQLRNPAKTRRELADRLKIHRQTLWRDIKAILIAFPSAKPHL